MTIPDTFKAQEFTYANFSTFLEIWKQGTAQRMTSLVDATSKEQTKITVIKNVSRFGEMELKPEQEGAFQATRDALYIKNAVKAAINDGVTGSGKTFFAVALIADRINQGVFKAPMWQIKPHWFIIITPKKVIESWKRVIDLAGLGHLLLTRKILVLSNADLNTSFGDIYCSEQVDEITEDTNYIWNPLLVPDTVIVDEAHNFKRPGSTRTKKLLALVEAKPRPKVIMLSATLAEKVNDGMAYTIASDIFFNGQRVTRNNYGFFARTLDNEPHKPSIEGVKRLRKVLSQNIFSFPYVKPAHKAINTVWLVDFEKESDKIIYRSAHERYLEVCRKVGKNTDLGMVHQYVALTNFRKTAEPLRCGPVAARIAKNFESGKLATAVGCAYIETVATMVFLLTDKYKIPREQISLVWGGKREYKKDDLLSKEEIDARLAKGFESWMRDRDFIKKMKVSLKYLEDKVEHGETVEEQAYRHERMANLKLLGKQSDNKFQIEVDNFQDGTTKILLFTIQSGGVGLSFDRDKDFLLPRESIITPIYNGMEFQQALGRFVRRNSLSDAYQYVCMLRGTVEEEHVAPKLDIKLRSSAAFSNRAFSLVDLLDREVTTGHTNEHISTLDEAAKDAEASEHLISDFNKPDTDDDDDDDEPENINDILNSADKDTDTD